MWQKLLLIAVAGGLGTLARYGVSGWMQRLTGPSFPWGTMAVNLSGCFLFGLVWSLGEGRLQLTPQSRVVVLTGFMGAFTTFSTFAFETSQALRDGQYMAVTANLMLQNGLGLALVIVGFAVGRWIGGGT